jgi:hypothetical protein
VRFVRTTGLESICGNHDNKFVRYHKHELVKLETGKANPMRFNEDKLSTYKQLNDADHAWLAGLPDFLLLEELQLLVVHAGVRPGQDPLGQSGNIYRHCRYVYKENFSLAKLDTTTYAQPEGSSFWADLYDGDLSIVHGHHILDYNSPTVKLNDKGARVFSIDTGCCYGGKLTALVLRDDLSKPEFVQVQAKKAYRER